MREKFDAIKGIAVIVMCIAVTAGTGITAERLSQHIGMADQRAEDMQKELEEVKVAVKELSSFKSTMDSTRRSIDNLNRTLQRERQDRK